MVRIGIVGIGFMGRIHFLASQKLRDARVAAVCSRDPVKLSGDWRSTARQLRTRTGHGRPGRR